MSTLHERMARAREVLVSAGIPSSEAALDAELLARHVLGWDRARLIADSRQPPPDGFDTAFDALVDRRRTREPISHITGHREFWGLDFEVTPDVLTPRPETELIVEEAVALFQDRKPGEIVDVGTGSGCLAIALAVEFPNAQLTATDVSMAALEVARRNAVRHGVNDRIAFVQTDLFPCVGLTDLAVSNPPYVAERETASLPPEVRNHEPPVALFGGPDGLAVYRRLLPEAAEYIDVEDNGSAGLFIVEVGHEQHEAVIALAAESRLQLVRARKDLQGITRTLVFRKEADGGF